MLLFVSQGISSLLARGVYDSAFPLHDVSTTEIDTSRDSLENDAHVIHIFCLFVSQGSFTRRGQKDQRNDRQVSWVPPFLLSAPPSSSTPASTHSAFKLYIMVMSGFLNPFHNYSTLMNQILPIKRIIIGWLQSGETHLVLLLLSWQCCTAEKFVGPQMSF